MNMMFYWERAPHGGARLLRAFGETPKIRIPDRIENRPVTEIGAYCFAQKARLPDAYEIAGAYAKDDVREMAGEYLTAAVLPDSVEKIGSFAFYNCTSLVSLELGPRMDELGGDAFMNCGSLHRLTMRCGAQERSGVRLILNQISADLEVAFVGWAGPEAVLLFPEYYESYDEIAPAHLFGRRIQGEGFRARQCFRDGVCDFARYDAVFRKACDEERTETLCAMAMNRLRWPAGLSETAKRQYESYVAGHAADIARQAVFRREAAQLSFLCERGLLDRAGITAAIACAAETEWAEGTAVLLRLKERYYPQKSVRERYRLPDM